MVLCSHLPAAKAAAPPQVNRNQSNMSLKKLAHWAWNFMLLAQTLSNQPGGLAAAVLTTSLARSGISHASRSLFTT